MIKNNNDKQFMNQENMSERDATFLYLMSDTF